MIKAGRILAALICVGQIFAGGGSGGAHEGSWMDKWLLSYDFGLTFWSITTFFVVLIILKWKAWGPLIEALDKRERDIKTALSSADKAKEEATKIAEDYEAMIRDARVEAQEIIADSKAAGERVREEIQNSAKQEASDLLEKAESQIQAEKEKAIQEIKTSIIDFSIQAASKVIERNLDSEDNRKLIKKTVEGIGEA